MVTMLDCGAEGVLVWFNDNTDGSNIVYPARFYHLIICICVSENICCVSVSPSLSLQFLCPDLTLPLLLSPDTSFTSQSHFLQPFCLPASAHPDIFSTSALLCHSFSFPRLPSLLVLRQRLWTPPRRPTDVYRALLSQTVHVGTSRKRSKNSREKLHFPEDCEQIWVRRGVIFVELKSDNGLKVFCPWKVVKTVWKCGTSTESRAASVLFSSSVIVTFPRWWKRVGFLFYFWLVDSLGAIECFNGYLMTSAPHT